MYCSFLSQPHETHGLERRRPKESRNINIFVVHQKLTDYVIKIEVEL